MDQDSLLLSESGEVQQKGKEGYNAIPAVTDYKQPTLIGNVRNFKRFTWVEWVFVFVGLISFLFSLGITIERFVHFEKHFNESSEAYQTICHPPNSTTNCINECQDWFCISDFSFAVVLLVNLTFCLFYGADGLLRERVYEFLGVFVAVVLVMLYVTVNFMYHMISISRDEEDEFSPGELAARVIRLVFSWIFGPVLVAFALVVYVRMGKLLFLHVGGNPTLRRAFKCTSFLDSLLFFNIQLLINVLVLAYTRNGTFLHPAEKIILPILVAFIIFITPMGWIGIWYELYSMTIVFLVFLLLTPAYYIYKIVNVAKNFPLYESHPGRDGPSHDVDSSHYELVAAALFVANVIGLLIFALIYIFAFFVVRNFKTGLKEKVDPPFSMLYKKIAASMNKPVMNN